MTAQDARPLRSTDRHTHVVRHRKRGESPHHGCAATRNASKKHARPFPHSARKLFAHPTGRTHSTCVHNDSLARDRHRRAARRTHRSRKPSPFADRGHRIVHSCVHRRPQHRICEQEEVRRIEPEVRESGSLQTAEAVSKTISDTGNHREHERAECNREDDVLHALQRAQRAQRAAARPRTRQERAGPVRATRMDRAGLSCEGRGIDAWASREGDAREHSRTYDACSCLSPRKVSPSEARRMQPRRGLYTAARCRYGRGESRHCRESENACESMWSCRTVAPRSVEGCWATPCTFAYMTNSAAVRSRKRSR